MTTADLILIREYTFLYRKYFAQGLSVYEKEWLGELFNINFSLYKTIALDVIWKLKPHNNFYYRVQWQ